MSTVQVIIYKSGRIEEKELPKTSKACRALSKQIEDMILSGVVEKSYREHREDKKR